MFFFIPFLCFDGNHLVTKTLAKRIEEDQTSKKKTLHLKYNTIIFFFLHNLVCIGVFSFVFFVGFCR